MYGDKAVGWDGLPPPAYWRPFLDEMTSLMRLVEDHINGETGRLTIQDVLRMNDRSAKKMAAVERMAPPEGKFPVFTQTGWVQRILGFGWRLAEMKRDINLMRTALWRMPVSIGVVFLEADLETLLARNRARREKPETAHEDRSHQVPFMLEAIPIAKSVLKERGIPVAEIDVQHQDEDAARRDLREFAAGEPGHAPQVGPCHQGPPFSALPPWWRR